MNGQRVGWKTRLPRKDNRALFVYIFNKTNIWVASIWVSETEKPSPTVEETQTEASARRTVNNAISSSGRETLDVRGCSANGCESSRWNH